MIGYPYLLSKASATENESTLREGEALFSDRTGIAADPNPKSGYRTFGVIGNKLVSPDRRSVLILQMNGDLQLRKGAFDSEGNQLLANGQKIVAPDQYTAPVVWSISQFPNWKTIENANLGPFSLTLTNRTLELGSLKTGTVLLTLATFPKDSGVKFLYINNLPDLIVTANSKDLWKLTKGNINEPAKSLQEQDIEIANSTIAAPTYPAPPITPVPSTNQSTQNQSTPNQSTQNGSNTNQQNQVAIPTTGSSSIYLIIAVAAAAYFYFKK